jgi:hypothetical protein
MLRFRSDDLKEQILRAFAEVTSISASFEKDGYEYTCFEFHNLCRRFIVLRTEEIHVNNLDVVAEISKLFEFLAEVGYKLEPKAEDIPEPLAITTEDEDLPF